MKLYLTVGLPCSGKSTYVNSKYPNAAIIGFDYSLQEMMIKYGCDYETAFSEHSKEASSHFNAQFRDAIKNRKEIIIDQTNMTAKSRLKKINSVPKDYEKYCLVFNTPYADLYKRNLQRQNETGKFIPQAVFDKFINMYEKPSFDEGFNDIIHIVG